MFFASLKRKMKKIRFSPASRKYTSFFARLSSIMNKKNAQRYAIVTGLFFLTVVSASSLFYYNELRAPESSSSPEVEFSSLSPSGSLGGEILPASCESVPQEAHCIAGYADKNGYVCTQYETLNCCAANQGQACPSSLNACNQTQSNGTIQCDGSCSSTPPAVPPGYGNACPSALNACNQTQSNGAIQCDGSCSSTPPPLPPGYGNACTSSLNACSQTQSNGTIQCDNSCSSTPPANPPGYGNACTGSASPANACGQSNPGGAGTIQCNGSCSGATGSTPANPPWFGVGCTSALNACSQTNSGTYNCAGTCSASTPANPPGYGNACTSAPNACGMTNPGTNTCTGACSSVPPSNALCPAPTLTFIADPTVIVSGNSSTLTWTPTNATSCWAWGGGIDGWKSPTGGNQVVSPATTTTYFMECWNSASVSSGVKQAAVNVTVPLPTVDLKINGSNGPLNLTQGATKNISWTTANAVSCTASSNDGFTGSKSVPTGGESVTANVTSNHTLTCLNSLGNGNSDSVQVNVSCSQSCGSWSDCSVACGGGTQTRSCTNTSCLPYIDTQDFNTSACGDYNWKEVAP